jgi:hypothetical protein
VTSSARKPIFGFIFSPKPPTPGAAQVTWMRIPARGPWRLALLIGSSSIVAAFLGTALVALAATHTLEGVILGGTTLLVMMPVVLIIARGWVTGTYVNDTGVRVVRMWRSDFTPWSIVTAIDIAETRWGQRLLVVTSQGDIHTDIGSITLDTAMRPQTWLSSVDRMRVWQREARG